MVRSESYGEWPAQHAEVRWKQNTSSMGCKDVLVCTCWGRAMLCGRIGCGIVSACCVWPVSGSKCNGRLWAHAECLISDGVGPCSLSGCAGAAVCVCDAPCRSAVDAVGRLWHGLERFTWNECAVVRAGGAAAALWEAGGEAVLGVPVGPRGGE